MKAGDIVRINKRIVTGTVRDYYLGEIGICLGPPRDVYARSDNVWCVMFPDCVEDFHIQHFDIITTTEMAQ